MIGNILHKNLIIYIMNQLMQQSFFTKEAVIFSSLVFMVLLSSCSTARKHYEKVVTNKFSESFKGDTGVISIEELEKYPEPLQRYFNFAGLPGSRKIKTVNLKQEGFFRMKPDQEWSPIKAEQVYKTDEPFFAWYAEMKGPLGMKFMGTDIYSEGKGSLIIRLFGWLKIVKYEGDKANEAELIRYFSEVMWFPTAFLNENITWEEIDYHTVKGIMHDRGISVEAIFTIDDEGKLTSFSAQRYYGMEEPIKKETWFAPVSGYERVNGFMIPLDAKIAWKLEEGDYQYGDMKITKLEYGY